MAHDHDIAVRDLRRRAPAWEWTADVSPEELEQLRQERDQLLARVDELHVAAQDAHEREQALRRLVRRLATGPWWRRLIAARRLRRRSP